MSSIQTNVSSLYAQENLRVNNLFQATTIARLTSGYRINSSGDDAAGLAIANQFRSDIAELTQGVRNANDGISQLQIVDGGLSNISKTLDRLRTLATQSASTTFTGNRTTVNNEYQELLREITRQSGSIGLVSGGSNNVNTSVFIGGGNTQANSQVQVDLSGAANRVDATSLGLGSSSVSAGGVTLTGNTVTTLNTATNFLNTAAEQTFTFRLYESGSSANVNVAVTITGDAGGLTGQEVLNALNATSIASYGIAAVITGDGALAFGGTRAFTVTTDTASAAAVATDNSTAVNLGNYNRTQAVAAVTDSTAAEIVTFQNGQGSVNVTFTTVTGATQAAAATAINAATASLGIYAVIDGDGTDLSIQSTNSFSIVKTQAATAGSVFDGGVGAKTVTAPNTTATTTGNALATLALLETAVTNLGLVQGKVGTAQNKLAYAINLAQSQINNFAAAESRIRDTDVAAEAANLTKAQVLQQASLAALAQANSAPQAVLALLRG